MKPKVIFIGGYGRSGSTVLEEILASNKIFFAIGEVRHIWKRSFHNNQLCSCGKKFYSCKFWNSVLEESFDGSKNISLSEINILRNEIDRVRTIPFLMSQKLQNKNFSEKLMQYSQILSKLYLGIQKVSGCDYLIDSSKDPIHGFILKYVPNVELYIIHLVRDSRAVAYSWSRKKSRPEIVSHNQLMPQYSFWKSSNEWLIKNILMEILKKLDLYNHITVKYENFVENTNSELLKISELLKSQTLILPARTYLGINHSVSGNPIRFKKGSLILVMDNEWKMMMNKSSLIMVSLLTFPLLILYKYSLRNCKQ